MRFGSVGGSFELFPIQKMERFAIEEINDTQITKCGPRCLHGQAYFHSKGQQSRFLNSEYSSEQLDAKGSEESRPECPYKPDEVGFRS